jgi:hypothetical protein
MVFAIALKFAEAMAHHQYADADPEQQHGRVERVGAVLDG